MTDPRHYPDPLHVPGDEPTRARLQKAYEAGVADGHRIHVLALVLMIGLGFVIGFALASGVRAAASRSGSPSVEVRTGGLLDDGEHRWRPDRGRRRRPLGRDLRCSEPREFYGVWTVIVAASEIVDQPTLGLTA